MNCEEPLYSHCTNHLVPRTTDQRTSGSADHGCAPVANMDPETGIRYGVICCNDVDSDFIDEIIQNGIDLDYEDLVGQVKEELTSVLGNYCNPDGDAIDNFIGELDLMCESTRRVYESEGLHVMIDSSNDLWIFKSPVVGKRGLCSPCAPGACHLKTEGEYECYILPEEMLR